MGFISNLIKIFKKDKAKDTGLRGTNGGRLYVDKKVFYNRPEVRNAIESLKKSATIKQQIDENRLNTNSI